MARKRYKRHADGTFKAKPRKSRNRAGSTEGADPTAAHELELYIDNDGDLYGFASKSADAS